MDFINMLEKSGRFKIYPETDSTNARAKELALDVDDFTVLFTNFQTAGRGQQGNTWHSERDKNILTSIILKPDIVQHQDFFLLTKAFSVAISEVISRYTENVCIKWPNDIYVNDKKIAGLLVENVFMGDTYAYSIAGVGLNVNQTEFSNVLKNPTSLKLEMNENHEELGTLDILDKVLSNFYDIYINLSEKKSEVENKYLEKLYRNKNYYAYVDNHGNMFSAKILDIDDIGQLILEKESGEVESYAFKSIQYIM